MGRSGRDACCGTRYRHRRGHRCQRRLGSQFHGLDGRTGEHVFNKAPTADPVQSPGQSPAGVVTGDVQASSATNAVLTYSLSQAPTKGGVDIRPDGTYTYTPAANLAQTGGTDSFAVTVDNGSAYRLAGLAGAIQGILHSLAQAVGLSGPDTIRVSVPVNIAPPSLFDGFDGPPGSPPDPAKRTVNQSTGWDPGIENYLSSNVFVDGQGRLVIQAVKTATEYTSGRLETKDTATFGYGTLTARIKLPAGQGLTPAFWLVGADENTNPWPGAGEIDVGTFTPESLPPTAQWVFNKSFYAVMSVAVGRSAGRYDAVACGHAGRLGAVATRLRR